MSNSLPFDVLVSIAKLLVFCAAVGVVMLGLMIPVSKSKQASYAILKRNFAAYFSNPTGYVFICVFMLLSAFAAFWPQAFFSRNLADLDQLNRWFPLIMLVFIPAISMSIWAEERHEGTDELLLTIPASDGDIVLGKYLAAVSIYTVSLMFSMIANFLVLISLSLGDVDVGLFISTYTGYWFIGVAMLSLGMVASFLTSNLTIGFLLGALFNAPLVFLLFADRFVPSRALAQNLTWWSYSSRFADFGRGVISLSGIAFFSLVVIFGIYLSILLIGRRHWVGGRDGRSMYGHYLTRAIALAAMVVGATVFFSHHDWVRWDVTTEKLSSLSSDTKEIIRNLGDDKRILIEAFISKEVPQAYVEKKINLINMLREFESRGGSRVQVRLFDDLEPFTEQAMQAEEQYGITAEKVTFRSAGTIRQADLYMGAAFTCGLDRVVIPFFDLGIPVEYELIRSAQTVASDKRKKIGVLKTDANLFGGFDMQRMSSTPKELIITELEKQYEVEQVDANQPIPEGVYDVLLAAQPSSLNPAQMEHFIAAIRNGQPTAIFEDPFPMLNQGTPGTAEPKRPQGGGMFGGGGPPEPKGDIRRLWDTLGIEMIGRPAGFGAEAPADVIWQAYNPYGTKVQHDEITPEWVFASPEAPGADYEALSLDSPITSGLQQLLFLYPGALRNLGARDLDFQSLVKTGDQTGEIGLLDLRQGGRNSRPPREITNKKYTLAARIKGRLRDDMTMSDVGSPLLAQAVPPPPLRQSDNTEKSSGKPNSSDESPSGDKSADSRNPEIHVVYVCDIDLLSSAFIALRANPDSEIEWNFDNVPFVLNVIDSLAGDDSLLEVRKRKTRFSSLKLVDLKTDDARQKSIKESENFKEDYDKAKQDAIARRDAQKSEMEALEKSISEGRQRGEGITPEIYSKIMKLRVDQERASRIFEVEVERIERERERKERRIENELEIDVRRVQSRYKLQAVLLPLIPPILVGLAVLWMRKRREQESVGTSRLRGEK